MRKQDIKVGDEVRVFPGRLDSGYHSLEAKDGCPGTVIKTGRKYATAEYAFTWQNYGGSTRQETGTVDFDMETGRGRYGGTYRTIVKTPAMAVRDALQAAALATLKEAGFELRLGHHPSPELILAVAAAIEAFGQED